MANAAYDEFKSALVDPTLRHALGIDITDAAAKRVLSEERFTRSYYDTWRRQSHAPQKPPKERFPWGWAIAAPVALVIIVAVAVNGVKENADRKPVYDRVSAYVYCQAAVKDLLKSPSTAKFSNSEAVGSGGTWTATGYVESENSFGAMIRADFQCSIKDGDKVRVDYLE